MSQKVYQAIIVLFAILFSFYFPGIANIRNAQAASDFSVYQNGCGAEDSCPPMQTSTVTQNGSSTLTMSGDIDAGSTGDGDNGCTGRTPHHTRGALDPYSPGQPFYNNGISYSIDDTSFNSAVDVNYTQTQIGLPARYCTSDPHTDNLYHFGDLAIDISTLSVGAHILYLDTEISGGSIVYYFNFTISASTSSFTLNPSNVNTPYNTDTGTYSPGSGVQVTLSGRDYYFFTDDGSPHQQYITPGIYTVTVSGLNDNGTKNITVQGHSWLTDPGTYDSDGHSLHPEQAVYSFTGTSYASYPINSATISCPSGGTCKLNINFETRPYLNVQ